ncbi:MAG TPA: hypothetical protein V6D08_05685, partial [Candidatus Obscuribacterales bacterium]
MKALAWLFAAGVAEPLAGLIQETEAAPSGKGRPPYRLLPWTGDDFTIGHRLRDGDIPRLPVDCERTVDFVIAGG